MQNSLAVAERYRPIPPGLRSKRQSLSRFRANPTESLRSGYGRARLGRVPPGEIGGRRATPIVGEAQSINAYVGTWNYNFLIGTLYQNSLNVLYFAVGLAGLLIWIRRPKDTLLLWFSIFAITPAIWTSVYTMRIPLSAQFSEFALQPLWQLRNVALWFLLIDILNLRERRTLVRWAKILAVLSLAASFLDGCLTYVPTSVISSQASSGSMHF